MRGKNGPGRPWDEYHSYRKIFQKERLPLAFVDLDHLTANAVALSKRAGGFPLRLATKSLRSVEILRFLLALSEKLSLGFKGLMCYSAEEAAFLAQQGFDDLLVAYPTMEEQELLKLVPYWKEGRSIMLMVDHPDHLKILQELAQPFSSQFKIPICVDLDMSTYAWFLGLHFGVHRSSLQSLDQLQNLLNHLKQCPDLILVGAMGYEAQIAGVGDAVKGNTIKNWIIRWLKKWSFPKLARRRQEMVTLIEKNGYRLSLVNGGGTGSLEWTIQDPSVTEVTMGSGLYSPTLFDDFQDFQHQGAAFFALPITRQPKPNVFTCHGGGYVASGSAGWDKVPQPVLPPGLSLFPLEGAGEVQTPLSFNGSSYGPLSEGDLNIGDPVFFRHAKAGELCERFQKLYLVSQGKIVNVVPTYRGEGQCFL